MKKQILLFAAALISVLMACHSEDRSSAGDSTTNDSSMSSMSATDPMQDSTASDTTAHDTTKRRDAETQQQKK